MKAHLTYFKFVKLEKISKSFKLNLKVTLVFIIYKKFNYPNDGISLSGSKKILLQRQNNDTLSISGWKTHTNRG